MRHVGPPGSQVAMEQTLSRFSDLVIKAGKQLRGHDVPCVNLGGLQDLGDPVLFFRG